MSHRILKKKFALSRVAKLATVSFLALMALSSQTHALPAETQAVGASAFLDSIGINTHMMNKWGGNAYADVGRVEWQLNYIGVKHIRDCFCDDYGTETLKKLSADIGTRVNLWANGAIYDRVIAGVKANPKIIDSVEGANEADAFPQNFQGLTGVQAGVALQKKFFADVKGYAATASVPVNSLTVIRNESLPIIGDISPYVDRTSSHIYPQWGGYNGELPYPYIQILTKKMNAMAPGKPSIITEGGWWTKPHPRGVTEAVHAKYTLNYLLDAYKQGVVRTYLYELLDEYPDPDGQKMDNHFGLFRYNGSAKPAAVALHNMTTILADAGRIISPGKLSYAVDGMPATGYQLLMQKSDGTYVLALWNDARIWDNGNLKERLVAPVQVMLNLGVQASTLSVYDPLVGVSPTLTKTNIAGLTLSLPDHPIFVFIKPVGAAPPAAEFPKVTTIQTNAVASVSAVKGGNVTISYRWQAVPTLYSYRAFVHFVNSAGNLVWQDDYWPSVSTTAWSGAVTVTRTVKVPATAATGTYRIVAGLFNPVPPYVSQPLAMGAGVTTVGTNRYQVGVLNVMN